MRRSRLPLSALRAFEAAGRHESFQKAADELSVTTSAVSRQIAELERIVGGQLFTRTVRKVELTEEGARLLHALSEAFDGISGAIDEARSDIRVRSRAAHALKIHVLPTFATRIVIPYLPEFEAQYPDVPVTLKVAADGAAGSVGDYDVFVDYSPTPPHEDNEVLFQEDALPVCAPHYIGGVEAGQALAVDDLLKGRLLSATDDSWDWKAWAAALKLRWPARPHLMQFETDDLSIQAALAGTGIALVERRFIIRELADHRLVPVGRNAAVPLGFYYIKQMRGATDAGGGAFTDWLKGLIVRLDRSPNLIRQVS
jgi:LysR family glycine cleavage system transcriptional activator